MLVSKITLKKYIQNGIMSCFYSILIIRRPLNILALNRMSVRKEREMIFLGFQSEWMKRKKINVKTMKI